MTVVVSIDNDLQERDETAISTKVRTSKYFERSANNSAQSRNSDKALMPMVQDDYAQNLQHQQRQFAKLTNSHKLFTHKNANHHLMQGPGFSKKFKEDEQQQFNDFKAVQINLAKNSSSDLSNDKYNLTKLPDEPTNPIRINREGVNTSAAYFPGAKN